MHRIGYIAFVLMAFAVAGCASGPSYQAVVDTLPRLEPDKGRIYFYRSGSPFGSAVQPGVYLNGQKVGDAVPGGVYFKDVEPGEYEVNVETEVVRKVNFPIKAGQSRYIKFTISMGFFVGRVRPSLVDRIQGAEDIRELAYIGGQSAPADAEAAGPRTGPKSIAAALPGAPLGAKGRLSEAELRAIMPGAVLRGKNAQGRAFLVTYHRDGTLSGLSESSADTGRWAIQGDNICSKWSNWRDARRRCFYFVKDGDSYTAYFTTTNKLNATARLSRE